MLWLGSVGIGAMVAPVLIEWLGLEGALIATGISLPALVVLFGRKLARHRRRGRRPRGGRSAPPRFGSDLQPASGHLARAPGRSSRSAPARAGHRDHSRRATPATASTSSPREPSRSPSTVARCPSSGRAATSARSRSSATCAERRRSRPDRGRPLRARPRGLPRRRHEPPAERRGRGGGRQLAARGNPCCGSSASRRLANRRGAPGKIRTCDLCLRRAALYPLSYGRGEGKSSDLATRLPSPSSASSGTSTRT